MVFVKKAHDLARKKVFFCNEKDSLSYVARKMYKNNIGSIIVKKNEVIKGIITVNDLLREVAKNSNQEETTAKDIMSSPVICVSKDLEIDELVDAFNKHKVSRMVLTNKKDDVVGIVRDIAVYKCMTLFKYDNEVKKRFRQDSFRRFY